MGLISALILARGGSKGIPKKNIRLLNGKPLIQYSIDAALKSNADEVWVSSDNDEILTVAAKCGAKTIQRPDELCTDTSPSDESLLHFIDNNPQTESLIFIQPTSVLLIPSDINRGIELFKTKDIDSVFSCYTKDWESTYDSHLNPINWDGINRPRRQDVGPLLVENGAFYITSKRLLLSTKKRYGGRIKGVIMPSMRSIQIDTMNDLINAELLLKNGNICRYR